MIESYKLSSNRCEYSIGNFLASLRKNRNSSDYDAFFKVTSQSANKDINDAKRIIKLIENKTYYLQNTTVINTDFSDWLDNFINLKTFDIDREKIKQLNTDLKQLDKDLQTVNKYFDW